MERAADVVRQFPQRRALLVGDAMLDVFLEGTATRLCPEAPVPVICAQRRVYLPGGVANTSVNARCLGAEVKLLSVIGPDATGNRLRDELERREVPVDHLIVDPSRRTTCKSRIIADSQYVVRLDEEDTSELEGEVEEEMLARFHELFAWAEVVIVSDYLKGVVTARLVSEIGRLNRRSGKLVVVDSKDLARRRFRNVGVITPNHVEAQRASATLVCW